MSLYSIFIPVYNEEEIITKNTQYLCDYLNYLGHDYELIIGSNGSNDRTEELGVELDKHIANVHFFHLPSKGPGYAFAQALKIYRGNVLITLDMDLSVELEFIPQALDLLAKYDVVVGSKRKGYQDRKVFRTLGSGMFCFAAKFLLGLPFSDYSLGAKAFRRQVLSRSDYVLDNQTSYITNLIFCAHNNNLRMTELAVRCSDQRPSRFNLGHEAFYRFAWVMRIFIQEKLLKQSKKL